MSTKLRVYFHEFPWLEKFKKSIGNPKRFRVSRLGVEDLKELYIGKCGDDKAYCCVHLNNCDTERVRWFWPFSNRYFSYLIRLSSISIDTTHVVFWGYQADYGRYLHVYKLPKGKLLSELLRDLEKSEIKDAQKKFAKTRKELREKIDALDC